MAHLGSKTGVIVVSVETEGATGDSFSVHSLLMGLLCAGNPIRAIDILNVVAIPVNVLQGTNVLDILLAHGTSLVVADTEELAVVPVDLGKGTEGSLGLDKRTLVVGSGGLSRTGLKEVSEGFVSFEELAEVVVGLHGGELADVAVVDGLERTL